MNSDGLFGWPSSASTSCTSCDSEKVSVIGRGEEKKEARTHLGGANQVGAENSADSEAALRDHDIVEQLAGLEVPDEGAAVHGSAEPLLVQQYGYAETKSRLQAQVRGAVCQFTFAEAIKT